MTAEMIPALAQLALQRQLELDEAITTWRDSAGVRLWCGSGCGNCCTLTVNATLAEALAIPAVLDIGQRQKMADTVTRIFAHARQCPDARTYLTGYRQAVGPCPFLDGEANCAIYAQRPFACRALHSTRPPDWCGVNLAELPELERDCFLASLDRNVVAFPTHYAAAPQELAANFERGLILAMFRFAGFGVTGNLPLLVWLAGEDGFAEALSGGPASFVSFLSAQGIQQPFLVQIDIP
jgi:Fe-S-cluster containining protein